LIRPGRFDQKIEVKLPEVNERFQILKIHLKDKNNCLEDKDISFAAMKLNGSSGADIEALIN
jgi:cell division protease FtsH